MSVYCLQCVNTASSDTFDSSVVSASLNESLIYKQACELMLREMREKFGEPKHFEKDDDLEDLEVFNNQQVVTAFEIYKNKDVFLDGVNSGQLKMNWAERFRRIDQIYEKLRYAESVGNKDIVFKNYYYVSKAKLLQ